MNNCEKYKLFIESYIEGELNDSDRIQLDEHIQNCNACRNEFQKAQTMASLLNESFHPERSADLAADSVMASISELPIQKDRRPFLTLGKIAAGFILITGLFLSYQAGQTSMLWKPDNLTQAAYTIDELAGTVLVKHSNSDIWQPLTADSTIYTGDQFLSTPGATVRFGVAENSHIKLEENSMLVLNNTPDKTNLLLIHGTLDADLASPHGPFFVTTPHGQAEALGTEFTVKVD